MEKLLIGNYISGNFNCSTKISDISKATLEKHDNELFICVNGSKTALIPVDQNSINVVEQFDSHFSDENSSIYRIELNDDVVFIILYTYKETFRLCDNDHKMFIYVDRMLEIKLLTENTYMIIEGTEKRPLEYKKDIPTFLTNEFIYNKSLFVTETNKDDEIVIYGRNYQARIKNERTGVFVIKRLTKRNKNRDYDLSYSQIYGNVKFITFEDSISISSNDLTPNKKARTSEVIKAWNQYMDFERELFNEEMDNSHLFHYNGFKIVGDNVLFLIDDEDTLYIDAAKNGEYEFIPFVDDETNYPNDFESIREFRKSNYTIYLRKCINEDFDGNTLIFKYNDRIDPSWQKSKGIIYISSFSLDIEQRRRKAIKKKIDSKENVSANIIINLADPDVEDTKTGRDNKVLTDAVMIKMFGKKIDVKEKYRTAMEIAVNTPDIALIQGPPGTGKTTLIRGIIARLNEIGKKIKILVSAEQHEALFNAVGVASKNNLIPPFITSKRYNTDTDEEDDSIFRSNVKKFQESFLSLCDNILNENKNVGNGHSSIISQLVYCFTNMKNSNYSINEIRANLDTISVLLGELGCLSEVSNEYSALSAYVFSETSKGNIESDDISTRMLQRKINSQRTTIEQFNDDGIYQLEELQSRLESQGYTQFMMPQKLYSNMTSGEQEKITASFPDYVLYVEDIINKFSPNEIVGAMDQVKVDVPKLVNSLYFKIMEVSKNHVKSFYDIVEDLKFRLSDMDNAIDIVKNYTRVIGSTCAQANRSIDYISTKDEKYDFVIIDEAARANPLDIMIPMMLGRQVILIGDQKQLPHYIETTYVKKFEQKNKRFANYDSNLLTKSFFEILYDNLEKAYTDGRIKFKRTARIEEQHRMHPMIGNFISNEFYDGAIENGTSTFANINDYHVFDGKNVVWLNVPLVKGPEQKNQSSKIRYAEVDRIIDALKLLIKNNMDRKLDIGLISFYGGQVELLNEKIKEAFPEDYFNTDSDSSVTISCNTVDSYQGKEFDIVILSGVRSNLEPLSTDALGFIDYSDSRINVALSRAKKLLIVVADSETFGKNKHFKNFINYVKKEGHYE